MALDVAQRAIQQELDRLRDQVKRLETALDHVAGRNGQTRRTTRGGASAQKSRRKASTNGRRKRAKRVSRGEREQQVLGIIKQRPGISQADLARQVGVSAAYINTLVKRLETERKITKAADGLRARR